MTLITDITGCTFALILLDVAQVCLFYTCMPARMYWTGTRIKWYTGTIYF